MTMRKKLSKGWLAIAIVVSLAAGYLIGMSPRERQPQMQAALKNLRAAESHLVKATSDKGGHRVKALEHTRDAIQEVIKGIEYDNRK